MSFSFQTFVVLSKTLKLTNDVIIDPEKDRNDISKEKIKKASNKQENI